MNDTCASCYYGKLRPAEQGALKLYCFNAPPHVTTIALGAPGGLSIINISARPEVQNSDFCSRWKPLVS
jgi:hypothetical protein